RQELLNEPSVDLDELVGLGVGLALPCDTEALARGPAEHAMHREAVEVLQHVGHHEVGNVDGSVAGVAPPAKVGLPGGLEDVVQSRRPETTGTFETLRQAGRASEKFDGIEVGLRTDGHSLQL